MYKFSASWRRGQQCDGAQFVINPWIASSVLKELSTVPKSEYLVQSAAASMLGKQVIALACHWNIKVINVVRCEEQKAELEALGADEVICSRDEDVGASVHEITGGCGVWGAMDAVVGAMTQTLASSTRDGSRIFIYGVLDGPATPVSVTDLWRNVQPKGWSLWHILKVLEKREACAAEVMLASS